MPDYHRILITGAAGSLGGHLRAGLTPSRRPPPPGGRAGHGRGRRARGDRACDLADKAAALEATRDCDAILHFAGHPREQSFEEIVADTLPAAYHVYEGARRHGCRRVVYASSIHAVGFYPVEAVPDTRVPHRPDTFYGLTKTFVEDLASLYWDKFGLEIGLPAHLLLLRGAARPAHALVLAQLRRLRAARRGGADRPARRLLGDLRHLRQRPARAVSNAHAAHIGFRPRDSADGHAAAVLARTERPDPGALGDPRGRRRLRRDAATPTMRHSADVADLRRRRRRQRHRLLPDRARLPRPHRGGGARPDLRPRRHRARRERHPPAVLQPAQRAHLRLRARGRSAASGSTSTSSGYLCLAATEAEAAALRASHAAQRAAGAATELLEPAGARRALPASRGRGPGARAPRRPRRGLVRQHGPACTPSAAAPAPPASSTCRDAVTGLHLDGGRVTGADLAGGGRIACGAFVNAAGGMGAEIAAMAGIAIPVERRKRTVFAFAAADPPPGALPLMVDPTGVWCRPEGARFIAGATPDPDPAVAADDFEPRHAEWEDMVWPALAARSPALRGAEADAVLGRALRPEHPRPERHRRAAPGDRQLPLRQRLLRPRPAAGPRGRPRPRRVALLRRLPQPRPRPARLRAHRRKAAPSPSAW